MNTFIGIADLEFQDAPQTNRTNISFDGKYIARMTTFADFAGPGLHNYQIRFDLRADSFGYIRTTSVKVMGGKRW